MTNPNQFPLIRISQTPVIFQVRGKLSNLFQSGGHSSPSLPQTYLSMYLFPPSVLMNQFTLPSYNWQGICVGQKLNSLIFVIWPVRHKNSIETFLTKIKPRSVDIKIFSLFLANDNQKPVIIKILSNHFWPSNVIQVSDSFNNVFLRPWISGWSSCHPSRYKITLQNEALSCEQLK